jgi:hypothetical protein
VRLDEVVATAAPSAAPAERRERQFEAAKVAAAQRAATTLSAADASGADLSGARGAAVHRIGTRTFALTAGNWTDTRHTSSMRTVRVKPYSAAYFALLERFDELRAPFALMGTDGTPGVIVAGRAIAIAVATDGVEKLSDRELASLAGAW